jgi:hypothetical protein
MPGGVPHPQPIGEVERGHAHLRAEVADDPVEGGVVGPAGEVAETVADQRGTAFGRAEADGGIALEMLEPVEEAPAVLQPHRGVGRKALGQDHGNVAAGEMRAEGDGDRQFLGLGIGAGAEERDAVEGSERRAERVRQPKEAGGEDDPCSLRGRPCRAAGRRWRARRGEGAVGGEAEPEEVEVAAPAAAPSQAQAEA